MIALETKMKPKKTSTELLNRCFSSASGPLNLPSSGFHCHLRVVNVCLHVWICESDTAIGYVTRCFNSMVENTNV